MAPSPRNPPRSTDWLGAGWWRDLTSPGAAKKQNLQLWIFDEKRWPSQAVAGKKVFPRDEPNGWRQRPSEVEGPRAFEAEGDDGEWYVARSCRAEKRWWQIEGSTPD